MNKLKTCLLASLMLFVVFKGSQACDHETDDGSGDVEEDCGNNISEDPVEASTKFIATGGPVSLQMEEKGIFLNNNQTPSESNKWRIQNSCTNMDMGFIIYGNLQNGDYLQIRKTILRGTSKCTGYPLILPSSTRQTLLIGHQGKSSFKMGMFCFTPGTEVFKLPNFLRCKEVLDYVGTSDEKIKILMELLSASSIEVQRYINNRDTNIHKCTMLNLFKQHCDGPYYGGPCV